jgi:hypothetical protein
MKLWIKRALFKMRDWTRTLRYWIDQVIVGDYESMKGGHLAMLFRIGLGCLQAGASIKTNA